MSGLKVIKDGDDFYVVSLEELNENYDIQDDDKCLRVHYLVSTSEEIAREVPESAKVIITQEHPHLANVHPHMAAEATMAEWAECNGPGFLTSLQTDAEYA